MTTNIDARLGSYSPAIISISRIAFGILFLLHGTAKLFGWPTGASVPAFSWPYWWAGLIEVVVGLLLIVGLFTRLAALFGAAQMAVAYFWQHLPHGLWPAETAPDGASGGEPALLFFFGFLLFVAVGAGAWAIDARRSGGRTAGIGGVGGTATPERHGGLMNRFRRR